jgi:hypothetical protein
VKRRFGSGNGARQNTKQSFQFCSSAAFGLVNKLESLPLSRALEHIKLLTAPNKAKVVTWWNWDQHFSCSQKDEALIRFLFLPELKNFSF